MFSNDPPRTRSLTSGFTPTSPWSQTFGSNSYDLDMVLKLERMRIREALDARDAVAERLADACASVREKAHTIEELQSEKDVLQQKLEDLTRTRQGEGLSEEKKAALDELQRVAVSIKTVEEGLKFVKTLSKPTRPDDIENAFVDKKRDWEQTIDKIMKLFNDPDPAAGGALRDLSNNNDTPSLYFTVATPKDPDVQDSPRTPLEWDNPVPQIPPANTIEKIAARYASLAALPIPSDIPDDALTPIVIPSPYTLHDFIGTTSGHLRTQIGNYRVFQHSTTTWCPEREEHGYLLTPVFKCSTNPRAVTAHRWFSTDIDANLGASTECFYNREGKWYYAGIYKAFRLDDLCTHEWANLSYETGQALIKDTLAGRKNVSPQNTYETAQLYAVGALKVACVGLQCIGFNNALYRSLLEHAAACAQSNKWRAPAGGQGLGVGLPGVLDGPAVGPGRTPPLVHARAGAPLAGMPLGPAQARVPMKILQHGVENAAP